MEVDAEYVKERLNTTIFEVDDHKNSQKKKSSELKEALNLIDTIEDQNNELKF